MDETKTATFVKDVGQFFTGSAALYQLVPPILRNDLDSEGDSYVDAVDYVVAAEAVIGPPGNRIVVGTTLYQSDETGYVTSWNRLHPNSIMDSAAEALASLGYEIK